MCARQKLMYLYQLIAIVFEVFSLEFINIYTLLT